MTLISAHSGLTRKLVTLTEEDTLLQVRTSRQNLFNIFVVRSTAEVDRFDGAGEGT
jgi:hypothetical protein